jgi:hypothetical protein
LLIGLYDFEGSILVALPATGKSLALGFAPVLQGFLQSYGPVKAPAVSVGFSPGWKSIYGD